MYRCSVGCSKSQLHKARKSLRRLLRGEPVGKGGAERRPELQRNADLLNQVVTRAASREESSTEYFCAEPNYLTSS